MDVIFSFFSLRLPNEQVVTIHQSIPDRSKKLFKEKKKVLATFILQIIMHAHTTIYYNSRHGDQQHTKLKTTGQNSR